MNVSARNNELGVREALDCGLSSGGLGQSLQVCDALGNALLLLEDTNTRHQVIQHRKNSSRGNRYWQLSIKINPNTDTVLVTKCCRNDKTSRSWRWTLAPHIRLTNSGQLINESWGSISGKKQGAKTVLCAPDGDLANGGFWSVMYVCVK